LQVKNALPMANLMHIWYKTFFETAHIRLSLTRPQIHVPRISYIPLLLPRLHAFFRPSLINENVNFWDGWLSFENVPLKWHFPVGLLYDLYSGVSDQLQEESGKKTPTTYDGPEEQSARDNLRTWKLTLRFEGWPAETLAQLDQDGKFMRDAFTNSVKEVCGIAQFFPRNMNAD
jgi:autophagy-related protein 5